MRKPADSQRRRAGNVNSTQLNSGTSPGQTAARVLLGTYWGAYYGCSDLPGLRLSGTRGRGPEVAASPLAWQPPAHTDQRPQPSVLRDATRACMHACVLQRHGRHPPERPPVEALHAGCTLRCDATPTKAAPYLPTWWRNSFSCASFTSICDESCRRTKSSAAPSCSAAPATVPASATLEYSAGTRGYYRGC